MPANNEEVGGITSFSRWLIIDQCQRLLNMKRQQIADVMGISRPTLDVYMRNPGLVSAEKQDRLVRHLEFVKAAILTTEATLTKENNDAS